MIVTLTGASAAGKSTVGKWLRKRFGDILKPVVSITTREPRESDPPGEYKYISVEEFQKMKHAGKFIWDVCPYGTDRYGTLFQSLQETEREPDSVFLMVLELDSVGTLHLHAKKMGLNVHSFYVVSPPEKELRRRLTERGDKPEDIERRIKESAKWDDRALRSGIPYVFIRNDLDNTGEIAAATIATEIVHRMSA